MDKKTRWTTDNIPDQKGRIAAVTGSNTGIGFEAAKVLANKNAKVIIAVRNMGKGEKAAQRIRDQNKDADLDVMKIDLASLESVRKFAEAFKQKYDRLDLLINNAGVMIPPYSKTKDGFELQFGTNHLGHFALTGLLFDLIKKTESPRIVILSSNAHKMGHINFDDLNWEKRKYSAQKAYGDSKLANLYFTYELSDHIKNNGLPVTVTAAHPGWTDTELQRYSGVMQFFSKIFAMNTEQGTLPTLRAATDETAQNGDYFGPDGFLQMTGYPVKVESNDLSHNKQIAEKLWNISEELTGVRFDFSR